MMKAVLALLLGAVVTAVPPRIELNLVESGSGTYTKKAAAQTLSHFHGVSGLQPCTGGASEPCVQPTVQSRHEFTLTCDIRDESNAATCTLPEAKAFDHYKQKDLTSAINTTYFLVDNNYARDGSQSALSQPREVSGVEWQNRSTYLIYYDVQDENGNRAEQVVLELVLDDHEAPQFATVCNDVTVEAADSSFVMCELNATDNCVQEDQDSLDSRILYTIEKNGALVPGTTANATYADAKTWLTTSWMRCTPGVLPTGDDEYDLGTFTVTARVNDLAGPYGENQVDNVRTTSFTVTFNDTQNPTIVLQGDNPYVYECDNVAADQDFSSYSNINLVAGDASVAEVEKAGDASAFTAYLDVDQKVKFEDTRDDVCGVDNNLYSSTSNTVNEAAVGNYTVTYTHSDRYGLDATAVTRNVRVQDTTAPIVRLLGSPSVSNWATNSSTSWSDPWAVCADSCTDMDNEVPGRTSATVNDARGYAEWVKCPGSCALHEDGIDNRVPGEYVRRYWCIDDQGLRASVDRTIRIVDLNAPIITIQPVDTNNAPNDAGQVDVTLEATTSNDSHMTGQGYPTQYNDAGAKCEDYHDTKCDHGQGHDDLVDGECPSGSQNFSRTWDHSGLAAGSRLSVVTEVRFKPKFSAAFGQWTQAASGNADVDLAQIGQYEVRYNCTDLAGNDAASQTRVVTVQDTRCPFLVVSAPLVYIEAGFQYHDQLAQTSDSLDVDSPALSWSWLNGADPGADVSTDVTSVQAGQYEVTFNATDDATNTVAQVAGVGGCGLAGTKFNSQCAGITTNRASQHADLIGYGCGNTLAERKRTIVVKDTLPPVIYLKLPSEAHLNDEQVAYIQANGRKGIGNGEAHANGTALDNSAASDARQASFENLPYTVQPNTFSTRRRLVAEVQPSRQAAWGALVGLAAGATLLALTRSRTDTPVPV